MEPLVIHLRLLIILVVTCRLEAFITMSHESYDQNSTFPASLTGWLWVRTSLGLVKKARDVLIKAKAQFNPSLIYPKAELDSMV